MLLCNTRKMVPITGRANSFLEIFFFLTPISIQIISIPFFCSFFFLCLQGQPELCGSYHLLQSYFISSSFSMANLSRLVATSFSSLALRSSSVSTANLSCLLATTFSSLSFLSNLFSSPRINLLRVARHCFSWSSVSDAFSFRLVVFLLFFLLALSFFLCLILSLSFSVLQFLKLCLL